MKASNDSFCIKSTGKLSETILLIVKRKQENKKMNVYISNFVFLTDSYKIMYIQCVEWPDENM